MKWFWAIVIPLIFNLSGCGSSGNSNAPVSTAPHESTWVAYHRNDIVNSQKITFDNTSAAVLIAEHLIQCRVCHGAGLMGAKEGAAGPACLDCHVLDPSRYLVMCYSCHGYPVVTPQQWYSTNRAKRPGLPLDLAFIDRVRNKPEIHLKHAAVSLSTNVNDDISVDKCAVCHGSKDKRGVKHHEIVMDDLKLGCIGPLPYGCHTFTFSDPVLNAPTFSVPNCSSKDIGCHSEGNLP